MELLQWVNEHGFDLLQGVGIVASLLFAARTIRRDDRSRRISNLLLLTAGHREIWSHLYERPELGRVLDCEIDLQQSPVTNAEAVFLTFLLLHLNAAFRALKEGMFATRQALDQDIQWFLSLPIPNQVWQKSKSFLEPDFVVYVDGCLAKATTSSSSTPQ